MTTTADTDHAVMLTAREVRDLRSYLARGSDYVDSTAEERHEALLEMSGYLDSCLSKASGRPA